MYAKSSQVRNGTLRWRMAIVVAALLGCGVWFGLRWSVEPDTPAVSLQVQKLISPWASPMDLPDDMRYDEVTWLCAHNAMSNGMDGWVCPNQGWNIASQLKAGVHAQMWDVWDEDGSLVLKHGNGSVFFPGVLSLNEAFRSLGEYLRANPRAVVTVILESYVPNELIRKVAEESGVYNFCQSLPVKGTWPTLGEMRASGKRLVLLTDRPDGNDEWPMPLWKHSVETPWKNESPESLVNTPGRGEVGNRLLIVNHMVSGLRPSRAVARELNSTSALDKRKKKIGEQWGRGRIINFWVLDFVDIGDGRRFVQESNSFSTIRPTPH